jgi:hypothetical protein
MTKGKLWLHQMVLFGVLVVLLLWSVLNRNFVFNLGLLWWLLGAMIGFLFVFMDRFFYTVLINTNNTLGLKLKEINKKDIVEGIKLLLVEKFDQKEMVMRSFLFLLMWIVLGFFTMTSVVNHFARGFMLGIGIHLIFDLIYDYIYDKERLDTWFWQIKRTLEPEEKRWFVMIVSVVFAFMAFNF